MSENEKNRIEECRLEEVAGGLPHDVLRSGRREELFPSPKISDGVVEPYGLVQPSESACPTLDGGQKQRVADVR